jgi:hypothetical protein
MVSLDSTSRVIVLPVTEREREKLAGLFQVATEEDARPGIQRREGKLTGLDEDLHYGSSSTMMGNVIVL